MELPIFDSQARPVGRSVELDASVFGIQPHQHSMYLDVKAYLANQRQGTHKTKERGEVSGSTKKPFRQKGTGNARQGHKRSPLHRHGGTIFGPKPHDYYIGINKKVKSLARRSALSLKYQSELMTVVELDTFETPKTRKFYNMLQAFRLENQKVLLVTGSVAKNVYLSGRNLPNVDIAYAGQVCTYQLLNCKQLLIEPSAVKLLNQQLSTRQVPNEKARIA
jgi:large subunit ribosomal protein L4